MKTHHSTLHHASASVTTEISLGHERLFSEEWVQTLSSFPGKVVVVTDVKVQDLIGTKWVAFLKEHRIDATLLSFPAGEGSKNRQTKEDLEDRMLELQCGRDTLLVALGGGVVTDLGGFLAATYLRGISLMLIPTTLLGMVDAAIGGKTGVNTPFSKNGIGSYYPPRQILIDTALLSTLPKKEWRNGIAEVIKYGLIYSASLFQKLLTQQEKWERRDPIFLHEIIRESVEIKSHVVEIDFQETGYRRIVNFGHTIGHALETIEEYRISHGEAVALGMLVESDLSHRMGLLPHDAWTKIRQILTEYGFSLQLSPSATIDQLLVAMTRDKKAKGARPRFVLLEGIGSVAPFEGAYCAEVDERMIREALLRVKES